MNNWRAVVFDLDDTLFPERQYVLSGLRAVADWAQGQLALPASATFAELSRLFEEGARGDTFDRWLRGHGLATSRWVPQLVDVYRAHPPRIRPFPDAEQLLTDLAESCRIGLVTDGYLRVQERKFAALGLAGFFQAVVYSDVLGRTAWKPSPRPFELVLQRLHVNAGQAVYVGDNPTKDFRGARHVGMGTIRLRHPAGLYGRLEPASGADAPDIEISGLHDIPAGLAELERRRVTERHPSLALQRTAWYEQPPCASLPSPHVTA